MSLVLSPIIVNIYTKYFKNLALGLILCGTFILWPHQYDGKVLLGHVNSIKSSVQFIVENVKDNQLAFLRGLIARTDICIHQANLHKMIPQLQLLYAYSVKRRTA